jgi:hypothetical protein
MVGAQLKGDGCIFAIPLYTPGTRDFEGVRKGEKNHAQMHIVAIASK